MKPAIMKPVRVDGQFLVLRFGEDEERHDERWRMNCRIGNITCRRMERLTDSLGGETAAQASRYRGRRCSRLSGEFLTSVQWQTSSVVERLACVGPTLNRCSTSFAPDERDSRAAAPAARTLFIAICAPEYLSPRGLALAPGVDDAAGFGILDV